MSVVSVSANKANVGKTQGGGSLAPINQRQPVKGSSQAPAIPQAETASLSLEARRAMAEDQADHSFSKGVRAFKLLSDHDRNELGDLIQKRLDANGAKDLSETQANDIRAQVALEWSTRDKPGGNRALLQLRGSAQDYQTHRQEAADLGGTPIYKEPEPRKLEEFIPAGSEEAGDTRSRKAFGSLLDSYNGLEPKDRREVDGQVDQLVSHWEKKFGPATQQDLNDLSAEALGRWTRHQDSDKNRFYGKTLDYLIARRDWEDNLGGPIEGSALDWILRGPNGTPV